MIYAAVLAGGLGTRMGMNIPKQFLPLDKYPVFIHCIKRLLDITDIEKVYLGINADWVDLAEEQIAEYLGDEKRFHVTTGGVTREDTLMNIIRKIETDNGLNDDDIILVHDSVRPFLTPRIIYDVIKQMSSCDACNVVIPTADTIVQSFSEKTIDNVPVRKTMYAGQSPQGFRIKKLCEAFDSLSDEEKETLTETTRVCMLRNIPIHFVMGEVYNFKITTEYDYIVSQSIIDFVERKIAEENPL